MTSLLRFLLLGLLGHSFAQASVNLNSRRSTLSRVFETTVKTVQSFVGASLTSLNHTETPDCIIEFEAGSFLSLVDSVLPETWTAKYIQPMAERSGVALGKPTALCVEYHTPVWVETNVDELRSSLIELRNTTPCSSALSMVVPNPIMSAVQEYMLMAQCLWESAIDWASTTWSKMDSAESFYSWITANSTSATSRSSSQPAANAIDHLNDIMKMTKSSLERAIEWTSAKWSEFDSECFDWTSAKSVDGSGKTSSQPAANVLDDFREILNMAKSSLENAIEWTSAKWSAFESESFDWTRAKSVGGNNKISSQPAADISDFSREILNMAKSSLENAIEWTSAKWSAFESESFDWTRAKSTAAGSQSSSPPATNMLDDISAIQDTTKSSLESAMTWTSTKLSEFDSEYFDWTRAKSVDGSSKISSQPVVNAFDDVSAILDMAKTSFKSALNWATAVWSEIDADIFDWTNASSVGWSAQSSQLVANVLHDFTGIIEMGKSSLRSALNWTTAVWSEIDSECFDWTNANSVDWSAQSSQLVANVLHEITEMMDTATSSLGRAIDWTNAKWSEIDSANCFDWAAAKSTVVHCSAKTKASLKSLMTWNTIQYSLVVQHWSPLEWSSNGAKAIVKYFIDWTKKQYALVKSHWSAIMGDDRLSLNPKSVWDSMWDGSGQLVKVPSWLRFLNTSNDPDLAWESFLQEANRQVDLARQERQWRRELILLQDPNRAKQADPEIM